MPAGKQPNIVVFFWDNFGWGELGCYGGGVLRGAPRVVACVAVVHVGPRPGVRNEASGRTAALARMLQVQADRR
jgi:arylsulfatase A-like enzyme